jgi:3-methyladenine DNA glycosylase AlkC
MPKGATRIADIPANWLAKLNAGEVESRTLAESLAIDFPVLLSAVDRRLTPHAARVDPSLGITRRMPLAAQVCLDVLGRDRALELATHPSDTVRGIACFAVALSIPGIDARLGAIRPFAGDPHFGVREWAWMALRPTIASNLDGALAILPGWTRDPHEGVRRFASEATRPRGVWCASIRRLRDEPDLGLPILEPLRADSSRYVQNSVGNWLNDAGKDQPEWVKRVCGSWRRESDCAATNYIVGRALRSLNRVA